MLAEITLPNLSVPELKMLAKSLDINEYNAYDTREQILSKAFEGKWTLNQLKNMAAKMTSPEEVRIRKASHTEKTVIKQALEIKELKKENKDVKKIISVIQNQVAYVYENVEANAEQIGNVSSELGNVVERVDLVEIKAEQNSGHIGILVTQIGRMNQVTAETVTELSKIVEKSTKKIDALEKIKTKRKPADVEVIVGPLEKRARR